MFLWPTQNDFLRYSLENMKMPIWMNFESFMLKGSLTDWERFKFRLIKKTCNITYFSALTPKLQKSGFRQVVETAWGLSYCSTRLLSNLVVIQVLNSYPLCKIYCWEVPCYRHFKHVVKAQPWKVISNELFEEKTANYFSLMHTLI